MLVLTKTADPEIYDAPGQIIDYSYVVENTGTETLSGPVSVDDDQETVDCPTGDLDPGDSLTCSAQRTISQADLDNGSVTNVATATADGVQSDAVSVTILSARLFQDRFEVLED